MFFENFLSSFTATVLGGVTLTLFLFLLKEKLFPITDIAGRWYLETTTVDTAYNPYKDMRLQYVATIYREGNKIYGSTEKIYEDSSTGKREYTGKDRSRGLLEGSIEKNYLGKSRMALHSVEDEFSRKSTNFYELIIIGENEMKGYFTSMIADQTGEVIWQRTPFLNQ